jgi:SNF2 family DNA or RNA helicase
VVAPKSVVPHWRTDAAKLGYSGVHVEVLDSGTVAARRARAETALRRSGPVLLAMNSESEWRAPMAGFLLGAGIDLVVADEVQKIKAPGGRASRFMAQLAEAVPWRLGLSGTPCPHSPLDAYGVFRFLDRGIFGTSFARFHNRYAEMEQAETRTGQKYPLVKGYKNMDEYRRRFYSITYEVGREVLDLPGEQFLERVCTMPPKARKVYRELRDDLITEIESGMVTATNALTRLLRLQQIASGFLPDASGEGLEEIHTAKADLLGDVLDELDPAEPVVVFGRFWQDLDATAAVCRGAGRECMELSGRRNDLAAWQGGAGSVLAVQIQAGGVVSPDTATIASFSSRSRLMIQFDVPGKRRSRKACCLRASSSTKWRLGRSVT